MCNAWNHPPECSCGWGGVGHLGKRTSTSDPNVWGRFLQFTGISSFTIPNAKCPVCGDAVFFYQSSNGGRVFFDELGPPWPKHGCTDNLVRPSAYLFPESLTQTNKVYSWQKSDWMPFIVNEIILQPPNFSISNLRGLAGSEELSMYVNFKLDVRAPYFVRMVSPGKYQISVLLNEELSTRIYSRIFYGFTSVYELSKSTKLNVLSNKFPRTPLIPKFQYKLKSKKNKFKGEFTAKIANDKSKVLSEKKSQKPAAPTAFQIAYEKAKGKDPD